MSKGISLGSRETVAWYTNDPSVLLYSVVFGNFRYANVVILFLCLPCRNSGQVDHSSCWLPTLCPEKCSPFRDWEKASRFGLLVSEKNCSCRRPQNRNKAHVTVTVVPPFALRPCAPKEKNLHEGVLCSILLTVQEWGPD